MKKCWLTGYYRLLRIDFDGKIFKVTMNDGTWKSFLKYDLAIKYIDDLYKAIKPVAMISFMRKDGEILCAEGTILPDGGLVVRRAVKGVIVESSSSLASWFLDTPKNRKLVATLDKADKLCVGTLHKLREAHSKLSNNG